MKISKELRQGIAEEFNLLKSVEDRRHYINHLKYILDRIDIEDNFLEGIKSLQNYINIANYSFKQTNKMLPNNETDNQVNVVLDEKGVEENNI